ncbi:hypothetical protein FB451DRAFT_1217005, partial [Mycena latifolia]
MQLLCLTRTTMSVDEFRLFLGSCYQAVLRHIQDAIDPPPPLMSQQECLFALSRLNSIMEGWKGEAQSPLGTAESRRAAEAKFWDLYGEYQGVHCVLLFLLTSDFRFWQYMRRTMLIPRPKRRFLRRNRESRASGGGPSNRSSARERTMDRRLKLIRLRVQLLIACSTKGTVDDNVRGCPSAGCPSIPLD